MSKNNLLVHVDAVPSKMLKDVQDISGRSERSPKYAKTFKACISQYSLFRASLLLPHAGRDESDKARKHPYNAEEGKHM